MIWGSRAEHINTWWDRVPGERFWLDVTGRAEGGALLAAPRGAGRHADSWTHRLITHVRGGDVVFRYDTSQRAIAGWAVTQGPVERRLVQWSRPLASVDGTSAGGPLASWAIRLQRSTQLDVAVPLSEIARIQWDLVPTLRAFEDSVGYPLYYPFEIGDRDTTHALPGYVFKLPALFVQGFPALAQAAASASDPLAEHESVPFRSAARSMVPQATR